MMYSDLKENSKKKKKKKNYRENERRDIQQRDEFDTK